jgi:hypothetical protein
MKIHFIAMGGSAMHSLAIALLQKKVSGDQFRRRDILARTLATAEVGIGAAEARMICNQVEISDAQFFEAIVYCNPGKIRHKKLEDISKEVVMTAFDRKGLQVNTNKEELEKYFWRGNWQNTTLNLMRSGNFSVIDLKILTSQL